MRHRIVRCLTSYRDTYTPQGSEVSVSLRLFGMQASHGRLLRRCLEERASQGVVKHVSPLSAVLEESDLRLERLALSQRVVKRRLQTTRLGLELHIRLNLKENRKKEIKA